MCGPWQEFDIVDKLLVTMKMLVEDCVVLGLEPSGMERAYPCKEPAFALVRGCRCNFPCFFVCFPKRMTLDFADSAF